MKWMIIALLLTGCLKKKKEVDPAPILREEILTEEDLEDLPETSWPEEETDEDL